MNAIPLRGNWTYPTALRFGAGRIRELAEACREAGIARPLIVTDPGLSALPIFTAVVEDLRKAGLAPIVFDKVQSNPTAGNVTEGTAAFRSGGHDGVIAFGGGSALDAGKTIAFMTAQTRPVWDFEDIGDYWRRAETQGIAPIIAIPTTAGTGSEVGRATVITDEVRHRKKIIFHPMMMPRVAIADPELTVGLPAHLTAATGMDALSHCIEAFCAPSHHPMADAIAIEGARLAKEWLAPAVRDGRNIEARAHMMASAAMGATAFQKGLGAVHSVSHPIGSLFGCHHGLTNGVVMPYVIAFNRSAIGDKMQRLAITMGIPASSPEAATNAIIDWLLELRQEIGIPHRLANIGVTPDRFDDIAKMALVDPTAPTNPVELTAPGVTRLLEAMQEGRVPR